MFLRFGYAVGNVGLLGAIGLIVLGHMVTVPTALALAEIATNKKVEGGGEYFIISRSFGRTIGSVIGLSLYLSQAISVAFYMIAFAEAFRPLEETFEKYAGLAYDPRMVSVPSLVLLLLLMLTRGANMGVKVLGAVAAVLTVSLAFFFLGDPMQGFDPEGLKLSATVDDPDRFFLVFAICFPAFTGMTAGVGLSGDLANPRKSIPTGTLLATVVGFVVYIALVFKLALSAPPYVLDQDQLVMTQIALWGPVIPIGLGCACLSSAIGSILVAPRTLQALGADNGLPWGSRVNGQLAAGVGAENEPRNATLVTGVLALVIVSLGGVDIVARLISMFFMVTYGSLCAISFLEHLAARPSYRPSFRSRWYISLFGAVMCGFTMFQMDPLFALLAIVMMVILYQVMVWSKGQEAHDLADMFQGVMTQTTRYMQIQLQRRRQQTPSDDEWRPSVLMVNGRTFERHAPLRFLRWLCHRYGFGTYLHFIKGALDSESFSTSQRIKEKLLQMAEVQHSTVYMDTIVSPSMISALAQSLQIPGVSGLNNNAALFEFSQHDDDGVIDEVADLCLFSASAAMSLLVLRHGDFQFGERSTIHIWLTWNDQNNANLMVLLGYVLLGHSDWADAEIKVFAALPSSEIGQKRTEFDRMIREGRIPISEKNIHFMPVNNVDAFRVLVGELSVEADLTIVGFDLDGLRERRREVFLNHQRLRAMLFVCGSQPIEIK
ncbi:MAG: amino acid permease [Proteobacteria bacterium]|nr:amino acid permease [Pseudomonadota bacterium]